MYIVKEKKINDTCQHMVKKTLFKRGSYEERYRTSAIELCSGRGDIGFSSEYSMGKSVDVKLLRGNIRVEGDSG